MEHLKLKVKYLIGNSGINQVSPKKCTTFRTILKPRNDTISIDKFNANPSLEKSKVKITQHLTSKSQISSNDEQNISKLSDLQGNSRFLTRNCSIEQQKVCTPLKNSLSESRNIINEQKTSTKQGQNKILQQLQKQLMQKGEKDSISMEVLQKKMDHLINTNLQRFRKQKKKLGLLNSQDLKYQATFKNQFQDIISFISTVKFLQGEDRSSINNINKKIEILQKMIAIQVAESQVLKDKYLGWKNQRINTSSYINKNKYNSTKKVKKSDTTEKVKQNIHIKSKQMVGNYNSISTLSYNKPSKEYYVKSKKNQNTYSANRRFIPNSSYSTEFLNFGCIPNYSYKSNLQKPLVKVPLSVTVSSYQQQYKDKLKQMNQLIDFKELDSYQDKIKNSKMPFINFKSLEFTQRTKQQMKKKHHRHLSKENVKYNDFNAKNQQKNKKDNLQSLQISQHFYKTEQNRQFKWPQSYQNQNGDNLLKSEIKHHKLQKMKIDLKAMTMRCR